MSYKSARLDLRSKKNVYIPLICSCPSFCKCKSNQVKAWYHQDCEKQSYLTNQGDIICEGVLCQSYFIKNASFQCSEARKDNTWHEFKQLYQFIAALSQANQTVEMCLNDNDQVDFITTLNIQAKKRWLTE